MLAKTYFPFIFGPIKYCSHSNETYNYQDLNNFANLYLNLQMEV